MSFHSALERHEIVMETDGLYSSLLSSESIRLLQVHPALSHGPLECSLIVSPDYSTGIRYDALSYCWGDAQNTMTILFDNRPVSVPK